MLELKFSNDYYKLPLNWEGTQATLIGVAYCSDIQKLKSSHPQFISYDTQFREKGGDYSLDFKEGLVLTFVHLNTGKPFTTIRRYTPEKKRFYYQNIWSTFQLTKC